MNLHKGAKLSADQLQAMTAFRANNGRTWKQALRNAWEHDYPEAYGTLRQIRNQYGNDAFKMYARQCTDEV